MTYEEYINSLSGNTAPKQETQSKKEAAVSVASDGASSPEKKMSYRQYMETYGKHQMSNAVAALPEKLSAFQKDFKTYADTALKDSKNLTWDNATALRDTYAKSANDLTERADSLITSMTFCRDFLDQRSYDEAVSYLNDVKNSINRMTDYYSTTSQAARQYDKAEDYNQALAEQKTYTAQLSFDTEAGAKEIEDLEKLLAEYKYLTRWEQDQAGRHREEEIRNQYGSTQDLKSLISEKKAYLNTAKRIQEGVQLSSVANPESEHYDPDFVSFNGYVSTASDGVWDKLSSQYGMGYDDLTYEYINGRENGMRKEIIRKATVFAADIDAESASKWEIYDQMTEDEISIYNYYYAKGGKDAAEKYLDSIQETLNYRAAVEKYGNLEGNTGLEVLFGVEAGLDQFSSGIKNLFNFSDNYIPSSTDQMVSGMVREDLADNGVKLPAWLGGASIGQIGYDTVTTTSNMLPSMIVGAVNSGAGTIMLGASAAGNAYQEMLNLGYDIGQARLYSALVGASEAGLQYLLGGIGKLGGKLSGNAVSKILNNVDDAFARTAIKLGGSMASEGLEEGLQEVLTPWFRSIATGEKVDINSADALYSSLLGAVTGGMFEGSGMATNAISNIRSNQRVGDAVVSTPGGVEALQRAAAITASELETGEQRSMERLSGKVSGENKSGSGFSGIVAKIRNAVNAQRVGKLYNRTANANVDLNAQDLAAQFEENGYSPKMAAELAEATALTIGGYSVNADQQALLEQQFESEGYQKVMRQITDEQSWINQRRMRLDQVHQGREAQGAVHQPESGAQLAVNADDNMGDVNIRRSAAAAPAVSAVEEGMDTNAAPNASGAVQTDGEPMDFAEAYSAVESARENGTLDDARYDQLMDSLQNAYMDYDAGRIDTAAYNDLLRSAIEQTNVGGKPMTGGEFSARNQNLQVQVDDQTWQQAQKLAQALRRDIVFYNGREGENGLYSDGTVYVNVNTDKPLMQVVCHELTHSLEGTKAYKQLLNFVLQKYRKAGYDLQAVRAAKIAQYKGFGVKLKTQADVDSEIVAEYMEKHLLAEEQSILELVRQEPNVAKRILSWIKGTWQRLTAAGDAKTIAQMERVQKIYSKALMQSLETLTDEGSVTTGRSPSQANVDSIQHGRQKITEDYRKGELTDEEYDAAMDEYDRAEEDELDQLVGEYSFDEAQKNTAESGVKYSISSTEDGIRYAILDGNIFLRPDGTEMTPMEAYNAIVGQRITLEDGDTITFVKKIPGKSVYKELFRKLPGYEAGIDVRAVSDKINRNIVDVISASAIQNKNEAQRHNHVGIKDFDQREVYLYSDGEAYRLELCIANLTDGNKIAYVKRYIEKAPREIAEKINEAETARQSRLNQPLDDSIDNPQENVKGQFSFSSDASKQEQQSEQGWYDTDEKQLQAKKKGYPVLHGEQVVPFNTWVQTKDRGNYGLVTGLAPENKLLVSFHNKHDGGTADNVAIPYENLIPVPGAYQMTKEEFASLMESEPIDPGSLEFTEEEMREINELYDRARGEADTQNDAQPIDLESLPRKAQNFLRKTQRGLLRKLGDRLGVARFANRSYLQEIVDEISVEYLNSGTVSDEKMSMLFDKAYSQGIVADREFYEQYKHIKDVMRTTAVTLSEQDRSNIADFGDFRRRQFNRLRIVDNGGTPVDSFYDELHSMAPELFPESIAHPADQLVHMAEVARSISVSEKTLQEFYGREAAVYRAWAKNDFDSVVSEVMGDLRAIRRFAKERAAANARESAPATPDEAMEAYRNLKKARRTYERATAKNLLTQHDETQVGRLLRHEIELEHLDPEKDNVKGITAVYEAKIEYEKYCKLIAEYKRHLHGKLRNQADRYLETANSWTDKKAGIAYARETMRRNIYDVIADRALAREINETYFEPVHDAEAAAVRMKDEYRNRVREMDLSRKVMKGNLVSEAHAVQLLGEAEDNIRILENSKGRMQHRDGKTLAEWRAVVNALWLENPNLDQTKIRSAVEKFRKIYDELFEQMNKVRVENGYEPINYRSGYFPHFQPGTADGILARFGRAMGIDTQVVALPTTITGLTHTFKPGIQWFGNAQERLGFNTAYDAVEGFDKYIEGSASVIHQTANIQRLRAFATQLRYRTSQDGIQEQVDAVYEDKRLTDEEKQVKIKDILEHGQYAMGNFAAELDEYTNLLANKKSKYDRTVESLMSRKIYAFLKWWESRVGANMIAGNITSALTNFIPLTQAGAQMDKRALLHGMWQTLISYKNGDDLSDLSTFITNRRGSDPLVQSLSQKVSSKLGIPMEMIDQFVTGSVVRGAYYHNLRRGMSEAEAIHQADIFAAGVMADRSKGSMPTLMQASNPLFKMFTQFQLEVNNQFSEVFKDLPRNHLEKGKLHFAWVLFQYFIGAWMYNELYERLVGRRAALDPIGIIVDAGKDFADPDVGFGEGVSNLVGNARDELPFSSGLTLLGIETDGGRIPASSAVPNLKAIWDAATKEGWTAEKRWKELQDELNKLSYVVPPFGGNQVSKIWKGAKAFIEGGSYSVDAEGNDILQYPVYKDDPWSALGSLFRATVLGKSSLPEAQAWVDSGFDSLNAKETAAYQDMIDAGVSSRDAFELIQKLGNAKTTDDVSKKDIQRKILQDSDVNGECKAIAYYGLLAEKKERELMDALAEMEADSGAVTNALMQLRDASALEGYQETEAKYDAIIQAQLTDEEKMVLVGSIIGTEMLTEAGNLTQWAKFQTAVECGMTVDEYLQFRKDGAELDDYLKFSYAGISSDDAIELTNALDDLVPEDGEDKVSDIQKWRVCVDFSSSEAMQLAALAGKMNANQYTKVETAVDLGVSPKVYVMLKEKLSMYVGDSDHSLTNNDVKVVIDSMSGLTQKQRAVLWQLSVNSKSAKNNPYSVSVGQQVLDSKSKK